MMLMLLLLLQRRGPALLATTARKTWDRAFLAFDRFDAAYPAALSAPAGPV
jgi:hypothetical protein